MATKLPIEPNFQSGNSFLFSLKAWARDVAKAFNPIADLLARIRANYLPTYSQVIIDGPPSGGGAYFGLNKIEPPNSEAALDGMRNNVLRWRVVLGNSTTEGGANTGSNFVISRFNDAGAALGDPLVIERNTGTLTYTGLVQVLPNSTAFDASVGLVKSVSGRASQLYGALNGLLRWNVLLGNATAEGGGNTGSDFDVVRYSDAGAGLSVAMRINRSDGVVTFFNTPVLGVLGSAQAQVSVAAAAGVNNATLALNNGGSGASNQILGYTGSSTRWLFRLGNGAPESGANAGTDLDIYSYTDAGALHQQVLAVKRSNGQITMPQQAAFYAYGSNGAVAPSSLIFGTVVTNRGGYYNNGNGRFTAPIAGVYFFRGHAMPNATNPGELRLHLAVNGGIYAGSGVIATKPAASTFQSAVVAAHIQLNAGDYVTVYTSTATDNVFSADPNWSSFSGHLVG